MPTPRSVAQIDQSIITAIQADPVLGPLLTSTSTVAIWRLLAYIIATSQALEEQLALQYQSDVEVVAAESAPATAQWIRNQAFNFQYSASDPQIIQFNTTTFAPYWPVINPSYRIVTRCSVKNGIVGHVRVKVATGTTPTPLTTDQLNAFISFMNYIKPCGIIYDYISVPADRLYCNSNITYQGAYSGTIGANLLNAYNAFLANLPFDGVFRLSDLEVALKAVPGVIDIEFINVNLRTYLVPFPVGGPFNIVNNYTERFILSATTSFQAFSGYIEDENTSSPSGADFLSSTNLIPV